MPENFLITFVPYVASACSGPWSSTKCEASRVKNVAYSTSKDT